MSKKKQDHATLKGCLLLIFLITIITIIIVFITDSCEKRRIAKVFEEYKADSMRLYAVSNDTSSNNSNDSLDSVMDARINEIMMRQNKSKEELDPEGNGILYIGDYQYPDVKTVTIKGRKYDVGIGEYETDLRRKLPAPEMTSEANTASYHVQIWRWDNNKIQIIIANGEVLEVNIIK